MTGPGLDTEEFVVRDDDEIFVCLTRLEAGVLTDTCYEGTDVYNKAVKKILDALSAD